MAKALRLIVVGVAAVAAVVLTAWLQTPARLWANTLPGSVPQATDTLTSGRRVAAGYYGGGNVDGPKRALNLASVAAGSPTLTTVTVHSPDPATYGQAVTLIANVSSSTGTPSGDVTFADGAMTLGTGVLDASGNATIVTAVMGAGIHTITASYAGRSNFAASTSAGITQTINRAASNAILNVSSMALVFGNPLALTATVTATVGVPTGTVAFKDGTAVVGTGTLSSGVALLTLPALDAGIHSLSADYVGDANFAGGLSSSVPVTVSKGGPSLALYVSQPSLVFGSLLFLTATVTSTAGTPTGTVNFKDGAAVLASSGLSNGSATLATSALGAGVHTITSSYQGNANFNAGSSLGVMVTVTQAAATASLAASQMVMVYGEPLYLTVTVTTGAGVPSGTVDFQDGTAVIGSGTLSGGVALLTAPALNVGSHNLSAQYSGSANFAGAASNGVVVMVDKASTATVIASAAPNASTVGQPVHLSVTVSPVPPGAGVPTGVVTVSTSGLSCSATLPSGSCDLTFNATGVWTLTASYSGDGHFKGGVSPALAHVVTKSFIYLPVIVRSPPPASPCGTPQLTWHGGLAPPASIDALYVQPHGTSQIIYAGAVTAPGVYVSRDGGATWPNVGVPAAVLSLVANPFISTTVFAGTYGGGIYQTNDAGASWSALIPSPSATIWSLAAVSGPGSTYTLFAGTGSGIYYSHSPIGSWSAATGPIAGKVVYAIAADPENGDLYAATSGSGVFRSTTGGVSWTQTALNSISVFALATGPAHAVYAGLNGQGVRRSTNGGASWDTLSSGIDTRSVYALVLDPLDAQRLYAGTVGGGVFTSNNGGAGWSAYNVGLSQSNVYALALNSACYGTLVAGTGSGVWLRDTQSTLR
jgi:hypothetical protein